MVSSEPIDLVFWANILAGFGLILYALFLWLQARGLVPPSPRFTKCVRFFCLFLLLMPLAARYQYSKAAILYLSAMMVMIGLLIKLKRKLGI